MVRLRRLEELLFNEGWAFFVPYVLVYLAAWFLSIPVPTVKWAFVALHVVNLGLLADFTRRKLPKARGADVAFWVILWLFLWLPGAYLEFPGDPWEHFRRIFSWQMSDTIGSNEIRKRVAYFWGWTTMFFLEPMQRRGALGIYGAFWELMVVLQLRALLKRLGFAGGWLNLQSFALLALFGTNLFGLRYYALSSTPMALAAYFRFLAIVLDAIQGGPRRYVSAAFLLLIMGLNHGQEFAFALLMGGALLAWRAFQSVPKRKRGVVVSWLGVLLLLGFFAGAWVFRAHPERFRFPEEYYSAFGTFRIWSSPYRETLGFHGILALVLGALLVAWRGPSLIPMLSFVPVLLMLYPPIVWAMSYWITHALDSYRLFYAIPTSILLVWSLRALFEEASRLRKDRVRLMVTTIIVFVLSMPVNFPWRGRLAFQLDQPAPDRAMVPLDETAQWLSEHRKFTSGCALYSDNATLSVVSAHLGLPIEIVDVRDYVRNSRDFYGRRAIDRSIVSGWQTRQRICGILVAETKALPRPSQHSIGGRSGHWGKEMGELSFQSTEVFEKSAELLLRAGWKVTEIPPFYRWYDPPGMP